MATVYAIADLHLGHKRIIGYEPTQRPFANVEEHDRAIVERWNAVVNKKDTVYVLGDVGFGKINIEKIAACTGNKKLVMGNHDMYQTEFYLQFFSKVYGAVEWHNCILTHIPVHTSQFPRYTANIHGHTHSKSVGDPRYFCVSCEQVGLQPIPLYEVLKRIEANP